MYKTDPAEALKCIALVFQYRQVKMWHKASPFPEQPPVICFGLRKHGVLDKLRKKDFFDTI